VTDSEAAPGARPSRTDAGDCSHDRGHDGSGEEHDGDDGPRSPPLYEAVHARPDGESTVSRLALTAAESGLGGIVVRNHGDAPAEYDPGAVSEAYGVDVVDGVEVRAEERSRLAGFVASHRDRRTVVCVHGGTERIDRFAVDQSRIDVLAHPGELDHVLVRTAAENGVRLEANLAGVLRADGGERVRAIDRLRRLRRLVDKYDAPHVTSADPASHLAVRAPRELAAVGETVGIGADFVREGLQEWGRLAARNRERAGERFIEPGVERGTYETQRR